MCGIVGLVPGTDPLGHVGRVEAMLDAVAHRGPDERRTLCVDGAVLGTARLALVDRPGSSQPMVLGSSALAFNGEIYNFRPLRAELEALGERFETDGDTEVLLHALVRWGVEVLPRLRGQFAVAFWDGSRGELLLARDRFGIVPLYWAEDGADLVVASEVKALRAGGLAARLSVPDVVDAGMLWGLHPGRSAFAGVRSVVPGSYVRLRRGAPPYESRYWQFRFADQRDGSAPSVQAARLAALLKDSVGRRMPADGDPAVLLSGGLDSSAVAGALRTVVPGGLVRSYSIRFTSPELDESAAQAVAVAAFGTQHAEVMCDDQAVAGELVLAVQHAELPLVRTAPAASVLLARLVAASGTRAVLSGEGADELLCGYDLFKLAALRTRPELAPDDQTFRRLLREVLGQEVVRGRSVSPVFFDQGTDDADDLLLSHLQRWRASARLLGYLAPRWRAALGAQEVLDGVRRRLPPECAGWSTTERAQYLEVTYFLPSALLASQCDRPFMASGVEARYPFLDEDLVDYVLTLPERAKLDGLREKVVLRDASVELVPPVLRERPKQPYTAPEGELFRSATGDALLETYASPQAVDRHGVFDAGRVAWLVAKLRRGRTSFFDDLALLWVVSTQILAETYGVDDFEETT